MRSHSPACYGGYSYVSKEFENKGVLCFVLWLEEWFVGIWCAVVTYKQNKEFIEDDFVLIRGIQKGSRPSKPIGACVRGTA